MGSTVGLRGSIILQVQGEGPVHTLVAQANNAGELRGLALGYENVSDQSSFKQLQGKGRLVLTIEGGQNKRYQGLVEIVGDHLSDALDVYFKQSEQIATHIQLVADQHHATCFLLQQLPGEEDETSLERWQHFKILSDTLSEQELLTLEAETLIHRLFHQEDVQLFDSTPLVFHCRCSREKVLPAIEQMGYEEAMKLIAEQGEIRADCDFCNHAYRFDQVDIASVFLADKNAPPTQQ